MTNQPPPREGDAEPNPPMSAPGADSGAGDTTITHALPPQGQPFAPGIFVPESQPANLDQPAQQPVEHTPAGPAVDPAHTVAVPPTVNPQYAPQPAIGPAQTVVGPVDQRPSYTPYGPIPGTPGSRQPTFGQPPNMGQPGSHQPPFGFPAPGQPAHQANYGPPVAEQLGQAGNPKRSARKLVWILVGVLVLALAVGGGIWGYSAYQKQQAARLEAERKAANEQAAAAAVTDFLKTVASGDADKAKGLIKQQPSNTTLLTNPVLTAAQKTSPIAGVTIKQASEEDPNTVHVDVAYTIGAKPQDSQFTAVRENESAPWKMSTAYQDVAVSLPAGVAAEIYGAPVKSGEKYPILFGTYTLSAKSPYLTTKALKPVVYTKLGSDGGRSESALFGEVTLTDAGKKLFGDQVKAKMADCAKQKSLAPAGCPWKISESNGVKVDPATISYTMSDPKWANALAPQLSKTRPTWVQVSISTRMKLKAKATQNGRAGLVDYDFTASGTYRMDLAAAKPTLVLQ